MQVTKSQIGLGERLIFSGYADAPAAEDQIFTTGEFLVVAGISDDGGLQCFPTNEEGVITSHEGDTVFEEEIVRLTYAPRLSVRISC